MLELSWYGDAEVTLSLGRRLPLRPAGDPGQPGRRGGAGPPRTPHDGATGWRWPSTCCATPRSTRCSPGSRRFDELPDVMAAARRRRACRRCATPSPTTRRADRVQRDRPRPHDGRPQLPRRGVRAGAAPARGDVRRRRDVPRRGARRRRHRRRHRPGRRGAARGARPADLPQPRRRARLRRHQHHDRGAGPGRRRPAGRPGRTPARSATAPAGWPGSRSPCTSPTSPGRATSGRCDARVHFVVPDGIDDPARPSGGNVYDRRVCRGPGGRRLVGPRARGARRLAAPGRGGARRAGGVARGGSPTAPWCCSTAWSPRIRREGGRRRRRRPACRVPAPGG